MPAAGPIPNRADIFDILNPHQAAEQAEDRGVPRPGKATFTCPHCEAYAQQLDLGVIRGWLPYASLGAQAVTLEAFTTSQCMACNGFSIFHHRELVWPTRLVGPHPPDDMPANVEAFYSEARRVASVSPRSAAALLRLALETLVDDLVEGNQRLFDKIGVLKERLDPRIIKQMDLIRGFGNTAGAHADISIDDDAETVQKLFRLMLAVIDDLITREASLDSLGSLLPPSYHNGLAKREADAAKRGRAES